MHTIKLGATNPSLDATDVLPFLHDALDDMYASHDAHVAGCRGCWRDGEEPHAARLALRAGSKVMVILPVVDAPAADETHRREAHELLDDLVADLAAAEA